MTPNVRLDVVDDLSAAEVRGAAPATRTFAHGFPRAEDLEAIEARTRGAVAFLIVADDVVVGTCGTHGRPDRSGVVELGWGVVEAARGRRVGTAAVGLLLAEVGRHHPDAPLLARTQWSLRRGELLAESPASEAILKRLGFTPTDPPSSPGLRSWRLGVSASR